MAVVGALTVGSGDSVNEVAASVSASILERGELVCSIKGSSSFDRGQCEIAPDEPKPNTVGKPNIIRNPTRVLQTSSARFCAASRRPSSTLPVRRHRTPHRKAVA
eukprot:7266741-Prymnesium_polylepis.1